MLCNRMKYLLRWIKIKAAKYSINYINKVKNF
jgi:hypothetical protein